MNENYLWDKTGSDAEIEQLEAALQAFQHRESRAPKLPAKVLPFKPKIAQPRVFPALLKIAACVAIGAVALAASMQIYKTGLKSNQPLSQTSQTERQNPLPESPASPEITPSNKPAVTPAFLVTNDGKENPASDKRVYKARYKTVTSNFRKSEQKPAKAIETAELPEELTKEEKHAYEQLMLALTITSSNLKAVKNQAEGLE